MRWRRCVSPDCGSLDSAGFASPSCERCMPRRDGVLRLFWTAMYQLLKSNSATLAFKQVRKVRKRTMYLTRGRCRPGRSGLTRAALPILVQGHDWQQQQQFLREQLADADASARSQHRLALERYAGSLRLRADERDATHRLELPLHQLQAPLALQRDCAFELQVGDRHALLARKMRTTPHAAAHSGPQ